MRKIDLKKVQAHINKRITSFHDEKFKSLSNINLKKILKRKNPYLFRAKNVVLASELVHGILEAYLSSSEEKFFGDFLEDLAIFIASETCGGWKSATEGIDLEFMQDDTHYLVAIKSGPNWGNSSQKKKLNDYFVKALKILKQSRHTANIQPVLGICYGKSRTSFIKSYMQVMGQSFWHLISGDANLYKDIIEPVGYRAKEHNEKFNTSKEIIENRLTKELLDEFCADGIIDWQKIVEFNSSNLDRKEK